MNPTDIFEALEAIAKAPFDPAEFGFSFAEATDNARATVSKLRGGSLNRSDIEGGVLMNAKFHYAPADALEVEATLDALKGSKRTAKHKPAILIATDGETLAAEHSKSGERLHCAFSEIGDHFGFFLPAAGKDRYRPAEENPVDVKATGKLAKLYDALTKANPEWAKETRRHDMNQFMTRLIFCMFAEDVGIFPENQFSRVIFTHAGNHGEEAHSLLIAAFQAMNLPKGKRADLPAWGRDLEYVNGGLFAGTIDAPSFDVIAFRYLREACDLNWREINPDIFGSMIQSVADPKARAELGMHYTSVPNIMKVLGPLFLNELDAEIQKAWDRPSGLRKMLDRLSEICVFDPACGSGNFLVIAYRELRARELRILLRLGEIEGQTQIQMWSQISILNFYGIEKDDFAAETAKLAMFIAEYQANSRFEVVLGRRLATLPLRGGAHITSDNALRLDWQVACPPLKTGAEVYIAGNPPYYGAKKRTAEQNEDMGICGLGNLVILDYVAGWIERVSKLQRDQVDAALVTTSSICQGEQVARLWPRILERGISLKFAYRPFRWRNSAADNAGVSVTILGLSRAPSSRREIFEENLTTVVTSISPYLAPGSFTPVAARSTPLGDFPPMVMGSNPVDGKRLILSRDEERRLKADANTAPFVRQYMGGDELIYDRPRACLWIEDHQVEAAMAVPEISEKVVRCAKYRRTAGRDAKRAAIRPHRFCYSTWQDRPGLMVPNTQSEERAFIPAAPIPAGIVVNHNGFVVYDAPTFLLAIIGSTLHRVWLSTVGGRLEGRFRYAVRLVYNTFGTPAFTDAQKADLEASSRAILKVRYKHHPMTLAELYDPKKMPEDLRDAHRTNDELLESMYIGRPFRTDTERLDHLFKLYAAGVKKLKKAA